MAPAETVAEILDGKLHLSPQPPFTQAIASSRLGHVARSYPRLGHRGPGGWAYLSEPEFHFCPRPDRIVPDLAGWRRERTPDMREEEINAAHYGFAPNWFCEVLSLSTRKRDQGPKQRTYDREGIQHHWHVDPLARALKVFRLQSTNWSWVAL